jgi:hypothetical protein
MISSIIISICQDGLKHSYHKKLDYNSGLVAGSGSTLVIVYNSLRGTFLKWKNGFCVKC